jgi:N-acetylglucosamine-6-phosphate deacetylase
MKVIGKHFATARPISLEISDGKIGQISELDIDRDLPWIAPGFVDVQVNGYGGQEFNDPDLTVAKVADVSRRLDADGVTSYCPTSTTHSFEVLAHSLATVAEAMETNEAVARRAIGIHLEGPYISVEDGPRGAHPLEHCRPPNWDEFQRLQEQARGHIRILTMSPEYDESDSFITKVVASGVLVAIGHTAASSDQIHRAVESGARLSTHLGNGAHGQIRRHPNYIWDQLAEDRLTASLIADGHHLPPSVVKSFVRSKSPERCILVSDITGMAGMPPGRYDNSTLGAVEVLDDGRLVVAGQRQYLAGAALPIGVGIANIISFAGLELEAAIEMATSRPLELLGKSGGFLQADLAANLVQFELSNGDDDLPEKLDVLGTMNTGETVFGEMCTAAE